MKRAVLILFCLFATSTVFSQTKREIKEVKRTLLEIFKLCEKKNDKDLAEYIVYRGNNKERRWKSICNPKNQGELKRVERIRKRIESKMLPYKYEFKNFLSEKESEGRWYVWQLEYLIKDEEKTISFAFLKIDDLFVLGDID